MKMKTTWFLCLSALALTFVACTGDDRGADEQPGSIVGEWVFQKNEVYHNGKLTERFTAVEEVDRMIAVFREDGTYRYYDYPPEGFYEGAYTYDERTGTLTMRSGEVDSTDSPESCRAEITSRRMVWTYPADEAGWMLVEYYLRR